jgi:hypothetical protein
MPATLQINIVWVSTEHGGSSAVLVPPDKTIEYVGKAMSVVEP